MGERRGILSCEIEVSGTSGEKMKRSGGHRVNISVFLLAAEDKARDQFSVLYGSKLYLPSSEERP